jgi:hypothetical protein
MSWRAIALAAVVCTAALLYTARLDRVPSFLSTDETAFVLQARSIATTGRDTHGRLLPVYFQVFENVWFHPALVYAIVLNRCDYLDQAFVTAEGRFTAMSNYRIPVTGTFASGGSFRLSGSGDSEGSHYTLTFTLTKRG